MSYQINASELLINLSDEQQELLAGGIDAQLNLSNFTNRITSIEGSSESGPDGSIATGTGSNESVQTAAGQALVLGGGTGFPTTVTLPTSPTVF